jgi:hypothetical protein
MEINAKEITDDGVETYTKELLTYFLIRPSNIAVLSESSIRAKILALTQVIKEFDAVELACINSRETFEENRIYLAERLSIEKNIKVREILEKDLSFLDRIQIQTASAREFMLILRFTGREVESGSIKAAVSRLEKLLKDQGFMAKAASKDDIKRIFAVYYVQNLTQVYFTDYDGEQYVRGGIGVYN